MFCSVSLLAGADHVCMPPHRARAPWTLTIAAQSVSPNRLPGRRRASAARMPPASPTAGYERVAALARPAAVCLCVSILIVKMLASLKGWQAVELLGRAIYSKYAAPSFRCAPSILAAGWAHVLQWPDRQRCLCACRSSSSKGRSTLAQPRSGKIVRNGVEKGPQNFCLRRQFSPPKTPFT